MKLFRRKKKLINLHLQGTLIGRLTVYLVAYNMAILALIVVSHAFQSTTAVVSESVQLDNTFSLRGQLITVGGCMLFMMPFILFDLLNLSNRVAGPLFRYQKTLKDFVASGTLKTAKTRKYDLLPEFEQQFNEFVDALHTLYPDTRPTETEVSPSPHNGPVNTAGPGLNVPQTEVCEGVRQSVSTQSH